MKYLFFCLLSPVLFLLVPACKKTDSPVTQLIIKFTSPGIALNQIELATVVFTKVGSSEKIHKALEKTVSALQTPLTGLSAGNWQAEIHLRTTKGADGYQRKFILKKTFTWPTTSIALTAPTGKMTDNWQQFVLLGNLNAGAIITVPLDPTDPYFEMHVLDKKWDYFYIDRSIRNQNGTTNEYIDQAEWECSANCFTEEDKIIDSTAFAPFSNRAKSKTWNNGEIFVILLNVRTGMENIYLFRYEK